MAATSEAALPVEGTDWYHLTAAEACCRLDVDPLVGLGAGTPSTPAPWPPQRAG